MAKKVKFVQLVTGVTSYGGPNSAFNLTAPQLWSTLFALDDEGRVWMWTGGGAVGWVHAGPQPESADTSPEMRAEVIR